MTDKRFAVQEHVKRASVICTGFVLISFTDISVVIAIASDFIMCHHVSNCVVIL